MPIITVEEMKKYLRVDHNDDNDLIEYLITASEKRCMDIVRTDDPAVFQELDVAKLAVMYAVAYQYEHREDADNHALNLSLRGLLFGERKAGF